MISREEAIEKATDVLEEASEGVCYVTEVDVEWLITAIEALQKQISKPVQGEPLNHDVKINNCTFRKGTRILAICPSCGEWVNKHHKYCSECGQAIDWSECDD